MSQDINEKDKSKNEPLGYSKETAHYWPHPAIDENKMIFQLDDVAIESEKKATEIFDIIENINDVLVTQEEIAHRIIEVLNSNIKLFTILNTKFPDVISFKIKLEKNSSALEDININIEMFQNASDSIMSVMDIMQYQDINRQKIERVVNVMRSLSNYMKNLLESKIDDIKRVSSAQHISGDSHNNLVSNEEIEALLTQFENQSN